MFIILLHEKEKSSRFLNIFYKKVDIMNKKEKIPDVPAIGANLHKERRRRQLSLAELAASSGISKAMLSQIESDKVNPTIATMWKIAHALGVDFELLLKGEGGKIKKFEVNRADSITSFTTDQSGTVFKVLSPISMAEELEFYQVTLESGSIHRSQPHTDGTEEFITVLSGDVRVAAGRNSADLHQGDFIHYQSDIEHSIENISGTKAEVYMIVRFAGR